jgi:hypothetical protein
MKFPVIAALALVSAASALRAQEVADTAYNEYKEDIITLPLGVGLRIPSYDRVNGLSLPWGPVIRLPSGRLEIDPTVTYRSNLGQLDPAVRVHVTFGETDSLSVYGGRGTYTNDGWIRSDLINSLAAIGVGSDARNYYRGDRVSAELSHSFGKKPWNTSLWIGGNHEFDWSTGIHEKHSNAPWSFLNKKDSLKMRRVNPEIDPGHVTSITGGIRGSFDQPEMKGRFDVRIEHSFDGPVVGARTRCAALVVNPLVYDQCILVQSSRPGEDGRFTQAILDGKATFPTFGMQTFAFRGHGVASWDGAPAQRFSYLGGAGTLATVDLLALGGDRLVFVEGEYRYPLVRPLLPFVGAPVLSARYAAGSAGVEELPDFIQNLGVGLGLKIVKIEYHIDPNYNKTSFTHKHAWSIGFSLSL